MKLNHLRPLALSAAALLASAPAALALDANDFATKIVAAYTSSFSASEKFALGPGTVNGNDITYDSMSMTLASSPDKPTTISTKLTFTGVVEAADGSYTADALSFPDLDYKYEGGEITARNFVLKHIYVASGKTPNILDSSRMFGDASVGPIVLSVDGTPALSIDSVTVSNGFKPSQSDPALAEIDSNGVTSGLKIDLTHAKDEDTVTQAKALGLTTLTGKALESLTWSLKDGHLNISEVSLAFDTVGKLKFGFDITGYTPEFLQSLSGASQALVAGAGDGGASGDQAKATAALLQASQGLFLNSASIRYDDASITGKLLDFFAKQSNVTRQALIDQLVAQMPAMDEDSSDPTPPAVMKMMQASARAFLNNPHSIEVRLAPKAPLGVLGMIAAAMQPDNLADQVGLQVLVNDKQITTADADKETGIAPPKTDDTTTAPSDDTGQSAAPDTSGDDTAATPDEDGGASDDSSDSPDDSRLTTNHD